MAPKPRLRSSHSAQPRTSSPPVHAGRSRCKRGGRAQWVGLRCWKRHITRKDAYPTAALVAAWRSGTLDFRLREDTRGGLKSVDACSMLSLFSGLSESSPLPTLLATCETGNSKDCNIHASGTSKRGRLIPLRKPSIPLP